MPSIRVVIVCLPFLLSACGETHIERAGSGAVIGGVTGFIVGALCCADPHDGAAAGAAIGAASGALIGVILPEPIFFDYDDDPPPGYESPIPPTEPKLQEPPRATRDDPGAAAVAQPIYVNPQPAYVQAAPVYAAPPPTPMPAANVSPPGRYFPTAEAPRYYQYP